MYDCSISSSMRAFLTSAAIPAPGSNESGASELILDVYPFGVVRVVLDELLSRPDGVAHQDVEHPVGGGGVLDGDALEDAVFGVHRRVPQLVGVHLTESLEPLDLRGVAVAFLLDDAVPLGLVHRVVGVAAVADAVQRRLSRVHVAGLDERAHVPVQKRKQQRPDVRAVDVGVGHQDEPLVARLLDVELVADAAANGGDERPYLVVFENAVEAVFLDVQNLPLEGQNRLELAVAALLGRPARGVALHDEQFGLRGVAALAVRELPRQRGRFERGLAAGELLGLLRGLAGAGGLDGLRDDGRRRVRVLLEERPELLVGDALDDAADLGIPELGLRLALELRVGVLDGDDGGESLANVLAAEVVAVEVVQHVVAVRVVVDDAGERRLEPGQMRAALAGVDVVGEGVNRPLELVGRLHGDFDLDALRLVVVVDDVVVERRLGLVEVLDELADAALEEERARLVGPLVGERNLDPGVEERELSQAVFERLEVELGRLEDTVVRPKADGRSGVFAGFEVAHALELLDLRLADLEAVCPHRAVVFDLDFEFARQRVDDGDADAVEAAGDLVGLVVELPAGVEDGHDDLQRGSVVLFVRTYRNPAAVVGDADRAVLVEGDLDGVAVARERLVDGVVDDFVDEVVESARIGGPDVHRRTLSNGFKPFEDLNLSGPVLVILRHLNRPRIARPLKARTRGRVLLTGVPRSGFRHRRRRPTDPRFVGDSVYHDSAFRRERPSKRVNAPSSLSLRCR
nr:RecName: Full=Uncharacterized 80.2 kDa protein in the 5'region of gyrA and gyrB; AltName: Full=ORF 4 [Haloferax lucentense DSM 14919]pir/D39135/ hypothetical protein 4 (gyrB region) - Haloferax sp [Haloferax sp.]AAB09604.1 ORF4 [Haloferax lucentense DSM 14919]